MLKTQFHAIAPQLKGQVWFTNDQQFQVRKKVFNHSVDNEPFAIVEVHCEEDICLVIRFANTHNLAISVKGGGHSNTGSCIVNNGIVIDMAVFKTIIIAPDKKTVVVGAGVKNRELDAFTAQYGLAVPLGTCPDVGVIGATLGGGIGFLSCKYGLTCDSLINVKMIDANGTKLTIDQHSEPELFWALRGGGGCQFGVITAMELKVYQVPQTVFGGIIEWPISQAKSVLEQYSKQVLSGSRDYFLYAYISRANKKQAKISIMGFSTAPLHECEPFYNRVSDWGLDAKSDVCEKTYLEMQSNSYESELSIYWRNGFISGALSSEFLEEVIRCNANCPDDHGGIMFDPLGGAVRDLAINETTFVHRESSFICSVTGVCEGASMHSPVKNWVDDSHTKLSAFYNGRAYQNYEYLGKDELSMYFGENSNKLVELKQKHDPHCRFFGSLNRHIYGN
ncbi:FAD-binding oxidoreductase [uncultured Paraglaciecola sp.]|jgi:hypothetical protein|uniref:FAD-binding oxidoreductase n=1 Tax=uncultured Paraglaciecola sp. TaxID=1765024 RepID=UPI0030DC865A|tara:strand:- start:986 stop:2335 length:1350 start_codon:yes stop_codon:yes gene_type:complete